LQPNVGRVCLGAGVQAGYLAQEQDTLDGCGTVLDSLRAVVSWSCAMGGWQTTPAGMPTLCAVRRCGNYARQRDWLAPRQIQQGLQDHGLIDPFDMGVLGGPANRVNRYALAKQP
jgi:hypothetical protein